MAKSLRATRTKRNKTNLRRKVFGPVELARAERLSAKLLELANQARPERTDMEIEKDKKGAQNERLSATENAEAMDLDEDIKKKSFTQSSPKKKSGRIQKIGRRRAKNMSTFPSMWKDAKGKRTAKLKGR